MSRSVMYGESGGAGVIGGSVTTWANLPTPISNYIGMLYYVRMGSGGTLSWMGNYKYPAGLYTPNETATEWILTPLNVKLSEDSLTLVNITNWNEFHNFQFDIHIGDRIIYNELEYTNLTGTQTSTPPDIDITNWDNAFPQGTIYVAKKGGDYKTVKEACDSITTSTFDNPFFIQVEPGCYAEDPFTVPAHTTLFLNNARLEPTNLLTDFIRLSENSAIRNGGVLDSPNAGACIYSDADEGCTCTNIRIIKQVPTGSGTGFLSKNGGQLTVIDSTATGVENAYWANAGALILATVSCSITTNGIRSSNGGLVTGSVYGSFGNVTYDIVQDDSISIIRMINMLMNTDRINAVNWNNLKLTYVSDKEDDEAFVVTQEFAVGTAEKGQESVFGEGDSYTRGMLVYKFDGTTYTDISVESASPSGSTVTLDNGNVGTAFYLTSSLEDNNIPLKHGGLKIKVESNIDGIADITITETVPTSPNSVAGGYNQYTQINDQPAYKRTDNNYYLFFTQGFWCLWDTEPTGGENYFDTDYYSLPLEGDYIPISPNTGTPTVNINADAFTNPFIVEYYNGDTSLWEEVHYLMKESEDPYTPYAESIFELTGSFQLWYNLLLGKELKWSINDPMSLGNDYYWIRIRIKSAITVPPIIQQFKLHSNRSEIEADGYQQYFGNSRYFRSLPWDAGLFQAAGSSPLNQDLYLSDTLDRGYIENKFVSSAIDRIGLNSRIPPELDTSSPIRLIWTVITDNTSLGNIEWNINWGWSTDGGLVYDSSAGSPTTHPTQQTLDLIDEAPNQYTQKSYMVDLDISKMLATRPGGFGDILWITIQRSGTSINDTHTGNVSLLNIEPLYSSVSLGGHI